MMHLFLELLTICIPKLTQKAEIPVGTVRLKNRRQENLISQPNIG